MNPLLQQITSRMPQRWRQSLKRYRYGRLIRQGRFGADEPEFNQLANWIKPGDWVVDVGANVGTYTLRMSSLVGHEGRVVSFEPVPSTFEILSANTALAGCVNVTLINAAVSSTQDLVTMVLPKYDNSALENPHQAHLSNDGDFSVLCVSIDAFQLRSTIGLVKIDAEGHELSVLQGMVGLLARDHPVLIVEGFDEQVDALLGRFAYSSRQLPNSPNRIFAVAPLA